MKRFRPSAVILIACGSFAASSAFAAAPAPRHATHNGNIYLGGKFIELGVHPSGGFGPPGARPAGFFGTTGDPGIGMSTDHDGFGVGISRPVDYFLPGSPEERWAAGYTLGGVQRTGTGAARSGSSNISNVSLTDESFGKVLQARVVSTVNTSGGLPALRVVQVYTMRDGDQYFRLRVLMENLLTSPITSVRYMRSFDPDNTVYQGGSYDTDNEIMATFRSGDAYEMVRAQTYAANDPLFVALGTRAPIFYLTADPRLQPRSPPGGGGAVRHQRRRRRRLERR